MSALRHGLRPLLRLLPPRPRAAALLDTQPGASDQQPGRHGALACIALAGCVAGYALNAHAFLAGQPDAGGRGAYTDQRSGSSLSQGCGCSTQQRWKMSLGIQSKRYWPGGSGTLGKSTGRAPSGTPGSREYNDSDTSGAPSYQ